MSVREFFKAFRGSIKKTLACESKKQKLLCCAGTEPVNVRVKKTM